MFDSNFWERYFRVYDALNLLIPYREALESLEKELDLKQDDIVLDLGSGTGNLMLKLKGKCKKIVGVDFSKEGIDLHKSKDREAEVIFSDITKQLPFEDNYFSKVVSNNVIYTLSKEQQKNCLGEVLRVLKPGGKFAVSNVIKGYNPFVIYFDHLQKSVKKDGFLRTFLLLIKMLPATFKILIYNTKIKRSGGEENYNFLSGNQQAELLQEIGFRDISQTKYLYSGQAIMNSCSKP